MWFATVVGLSYTDHGARQADYDAVVWTGHDPLSSKTPSISPYAFCAGNPIKYIDPDGRMIDKYYNETGNLIYDTRVGNKAFVIRTTKTVVDTEVPVNGISPQEAQTTEREISEGNILGAHMDNVVEIEPMETLQEMRNSIGDDGTGGTSDANNKEYGGIVNSNGQVANVTQGEVRKPGKGASVTINTTGAKSVFHSHPSGYIENNGNQQRGGNAPSLVDIKTSGVRTDYVISLKNNTIYIYNSTGVLTIFPIKQH